MKGTASANTNIAVVKYWGKIDVEKNLPAVGSLSLTLEGVGTTTTVESSAADEFSLSEVLVAGQTPRSVMTDDTAAARVFSFLDFVFAQTETKRPPLRVTSVNTVPTASGLASSASAFCALAAAACRALDWHVSLAELSGLARRGSGSAARSVFGDFVEMPASSGEEVFAAPVAAGWDVRLVVVRTASGPKSVASRGGMQHSAATSSYYPTWVTNAASDFARGKEAILARDIRRLGQVMEHSTMAMHATTMTATPPFLYWNGITVECISALWRLRDNTGIAAYFTADAGPHVKVLCCAPDANVIATAMAKVPGVVAVETHRPGAGVNWL